MWFTGRAGLAPKGCARQAARASAKRGCGPADGGRRALRLSIPGADGGLVPGGPANCENTGVFIVDDLVSWLIGRLADAGYQRLATRVFGSDQARALKGRSRLPSRPRWMRSAPPTGSRPTGR